MKKIKKKIIQASEGRIQSFTCPKCHNKTLYDTESDVYKLLDIGYDDLFVCDECGASFYGRVGYDMKPRFTSADEEDIDAAIKCSVSKSDLKSLMKAAVEVQTREELDRVISSLLSYDKQLYLKYSEMARDDEYSPAAIGKMISDEIYNNIEAATNTCNIGAMPILDSDEDVEAAVSPGRKQEMVKRLQDSLINSITKWLKSTYGTSDYNELNDMFVVDVSVESDGRIRAEVRVELSYDGMWELSEVLNPVVAKYDKYAYFDMDAPGIMSAYLDVDGIYSSKVINVPRTPIKASVGFNDWLYQKYGWFSDDMTDDDYDRYWSEYEQAQEAENELNSTITAASYGGAFDIEDDQYFTRDDLNEFSDGVAELVSLDLMGKVECSGSWIENNQLTIQFVYNDDYECEVNIKIDMRKIRRPSDLLAKYGDAVAQKAVAEFTEQGVLDVEPEESVESAMDIGRPSSWYDPDDEDPIEFDDVSEGFDVDFDGTIMQIDERGFVTLDESTLDWAEGHEIDLEYGTYDMDPDQIIDDVWDLITDYLPDADGPAKYVINGGATLYYDLSNILSWSGENFYGDYEIDTESIEVEFDRKHSKAYSVEVKRI